MLESQSRELKEKREEVDAQEKRQQKKREWVANQNYLRQLSMDYKLEDIPALPPQPKR